jgi:hypothetical protein
VINAASAIDGKARISTWIGLSVTRSIHVADAVTVPHMRQLGVRTGRTLELSDSIPNAHFDLTAAPGGGRGRFVEAPSHGRSHEVELLFGAVWGAIKSEDRKDC